MITIMAIILSSTFSEIYMLYGCYIESINVYITYVCLFDLNETMQRLLSWKLQWTVM